ncbi:polysaccharide deacetylase family protein [Lutibacter sp. A80]|uniref:polysaccharide deacetylase family protein n=1 Tax=Lutibacter sp. A80 TaxID=2918453 RepID=UPI001F06610F|nr:polysaccharide deacetylase family protein [Lutibacter sp. A80]UMB61997.1 polysaccharide deacetylase family protein [Lutibacter sp. A80]
MIVVYTDKISNRLTYTLNVIFKSILMVNYSFVNFETFKNCKDSVKINYSNRVINNCISIKPHSILFENNLKKQIIKVDWIKNIPYYFKTSENTDFNYDIFASTFYIVSRYEEYFKTELDCHNRFKAENSLAFKNNFLEIPIANLWAQELKKEIVEKYQNISFPKLNYRFINTIDIDVAYAYKGKGLVRFTGGFLKAMLKLNFSEVINRCNYLLKNKDIFNTYSKIIKLQKKHNTENYYFINLGDNKKFDKNISYKKKALIQLIEQLNTELNTTIGIHPSYASNFEYPKIKIEKERLEKITKKQITKSRQHFLLLKHPETYQQLINYGITHDYTMGYASKVGFRAGICNTYPFFDIFKNKQEKLLITPFQIMDGTLNKYENLSPEQATKKIKEISTVIKNVNGTFVTLWHNSSLSEKNEWENWTEVYENLLINTKEN